MKRKPIDRNDRTMPQDSDVELFDDLIKLILQFCDYRTVSNLKLVSKKFHLHASDQKLWKDLTYFYLKEVNIDALAFKRPIEVSYA